MIDSFHFLRPHWLAALALAPVLWLWVRRHAGRGGSWQRYVSPALLPYVLAATPAVGGRARWPSVALVAGFMLAVIALAGPAWQQLPQPAFRSGSALVIAVDLSASMEATDIAPNRLGRARLEIADLLDGRRDGETALVLYAADAFVASPLTDDADTIKALLPALGTDLVPRQGSNATAALNRAEDLLTKGGVETGSILLVTDSVRATDRPTAADLAARGIRVSVLAVGTEAGAPVQLSTGGLLKDAGGNIVIPTMDPEPMRRLAEAGDGVFVRVALGDSDTERLLAAADRGATRSSTRTSLNADVWREEGPWLLLALLPLASLAFRRGWVLGLAFVFLPLPVPAADWADLWQRPDQRGEAAFRAGDMETAATLFESREWRAAAQYRRGDYQASARTLAGVDTPRGHYNRGNALAMAGDIEAAMSAYERVLAVEPEHQDARYNLDVLKAMAQAQEAANQASQQSGESGDQGDQQQGSQQGGQDQQGEQDQTSQGQQQGQQQGQRGQGEQQGQAGQPGAPGQAGEQREPSGNDAGRTGEDSAGGRAGTDESGSDDPAGGSGPAEGDEQAAREFFAGDADDEPANATDTANTEGEAADGREERLAALDPTQTPGNESQSGRALVPAETEEEREARQASEQWLRRIPEDPGGLLRRKFYLQYQRERARPSMPEEPW